MTQEQQALVFKDLCGRLPYSVYVKTKKFKFPIELRYLSLDTLPNVIPYLRPMHSITGKEWAILKEWIFLASDSKGKCRYFDGFQNISAEDTVKAMDYLNSHYFDYRNLIEQGLALEAPEGMYQ